MNLRRRPLLYILVPLLALTIGASFVRFVVLNDYLVSYEGECDPMTNSCFVGCEDEECTTEYYYAIVEKSAPYLEQQCGVDITGCQAANICLPVSDPGCNITYCDPAVDGDSCAFGSEEEEIPNDPIP